MNVSRGAVFLCLAFLVGCSGKPEKGAANATARADEPSVPIDKIEEIEGWIRLKSVSSAADKLRIESGPKEVRLTSGAHSFAIPAARYRANAKEDYAEIELGALLQTATTPQTVGPAIYDKLTRPARPPERCGGNTTVNMPVWHGCGPIACDGTGEIIGVGCGGWTPANAPK